MTEYDQDVEGYKWLKFDPLTQCFIVYLNGGSTFVEVCGMDRKEVAINIHKMHYPETPSDVKTVY